MTPPINKLLIGASVAISTMAVSAPAFAGSLTVTDVSGTHLTYESDGTTTYLGSDWQSALDGSGNIELSGSTSTSDAANINSATTLSGYFGDVTDSITFSSLTVNDWLYSGPIDGYNSFGQKWFTEAWNSTESGWQSYLKNQANNQSLSLTQAYNTFNFFQGYKRFSDPNVESVFQNSDGDISFDLAGHLNHESGLAMSEVVKVSYNGTTQYFYDFGQPTASGVYSADDGVSHTGNYNFVIEGASPTASVPEPAMMFGVTIVGGAIASLKRRIRQS